MTGVGHKGVYIFLEIDNPKVNIIAWLKFELVDNDFAVKHVSLALSAGSVEYANYTSV